MDPGVIRNLALGAIPPALLALVFFVLAWRRPRALSDSDSECPPADWRSIVTPLVLAVGCAGTFCLIFGVPPLRPIASIDWFPFLAVLLGVTTALAAVEQIPVWIRWLPSVGALGVAARVSLKNLAARNGPPEVLWEHLAWFGLSALILLGTVHSLTRFTRGPFPLLLLLLLSGAASQFLALGHSVALGQVVGMNAAMLTSALLVSLWRRDLAVGPGAGAFVILLTMTALLQGRLYGAASPEGGRLYASLLVLAPVLAWFVCVGVAQRLGPRVRGAVLLIVAAAPLALGLRLAARTWLAENAQTQQEHADDPYASP